MLKSILTLIFSDENTKMSHWDRLQQIIKTVFQHSQEPVDHSDKFYDENYCEDRCVIHPSNRYTYLYQYLSAAVVLRPSRWDI